MPDETPTHVKDTFAFLGIKPPTVQAPSPSATSGELDVPSIVDDEFSKLGYPSTTRLSLLGDLGRENAWNAKTIFQGHKDPKNGAYNRGIYSYQGDRQKDISNFIAQNGGDWTPNENNLRLQARFVDHELQTKYPKIHQILKNPRNTYDASEALRNYVKYDPNAPYNSYDADFRVKNNADWARKATARGLATENGTLPDYAKSTLDFLGHANNSTSINEMPAYATETFKFLGKGQPGTVTPTLADGSPAPVPESADTIQAQLISALNPQQGERVAVLVSPEEAKNIGSSVSSQFVPVKQPDGRILMVAKMSGNKAYGFKTAKDIQNYVKKNGFAKLIGKVEDLGTNTAGGNAVQTLDQNGNELSTSVVTSPEAAQAQIASDQQQFPQGQSQVVDTQQAVADRIAGQVPPEMMPNKPAALPTLAPESTVSQTPVKGEVSVDVPDDLQTTGQPASELPATNSQVANKLQTKGAGNPAQPALKVSDRRKAPKATEPDAQSDAPTYANVSTDFKGDAAYVPNEKPTKQGAREAVAQVLSNNYNIPLKDALEFVTKRDVLSDNDQSLKDSDIEAGRRIDIDGDVIEQARQFAQGRDDARKTYLRDLIASDSFNSLDNAKEYTDETDKEGRLVKDKLGIGQEDINSIISDPESQSAFDTRSKYWDAKKQYIEAKRSPFEADILARKDTGQISPEAADAQIQKEAAAKAKVQQLIEEDNPYADAAPQYEGSVSAKPTYKEELQKYHATSAQDYLDKRKEDFQSWQKMLEHPNLAVKEFATNAARGTGGAASFASKMVSTTAELLANAAGGDFDATKGGGWALGKYIDEGIEKGLPQDPDLRKFTILNKVPETLGNLAPFLALGALTGGGTAALVGAGQMSAGEYEKALTSGADRGQRRTAALVGGATGLIASLPILKFLAPLERSAQGAFLSKFLNSAFSSAAKDVGEKEALPFVQQLVKDLAVNIPLTSGTMVAIKKLNDLGAQLNYDPGRKVLTVDEGDLDAALSGALMGVAGSVLESAGKGAGKENLAELESGQANKLESANVPIDANKAGQINAPKEALDGVVDLFASPTAKVGDQTGAESPETAISSTKSNVKPVKSGSQAARGVSEAGVSGENKSEQQVRPNGRNFVEPSVLDTASLKSQITERDKSLIQLQKDLQKVPEHGDKWNIESNILIAKAEKVLLQEELNKRSNKQPWKMARKEFDDNIVFQGAPTVTSKSKFFTPDLGVSQAYAKQLGAKDGEIRLLHIDEIPPEGRVLDPDLVEKIVDRYGKQYEELYDKPLSKAEYGKWAKEFTTESKNYLARIPSSEATKPNFDAHKYLVKQALEAGEDVPTKVLADYPDLQKAEPKEQPNEPALDIPKKAEVAPDISSVEYLAKSYDRYTDKSDVVTAKKDLSKDRARFNRQLKKSELDLEQAKEDVLNGDSPESALTKFEKAAEFNRNSIQALDNIKAKLGTSDQLVDANKKIESGDFQLSSIPFEQRLKTATEKATYEQTQSEYIDGFRGQNDYFVPRNVADRKRWIEARQEGHKKEVERALKRGDTVPGAVLVEYPDLQTKNGNPVAKPSAFSTNKTITADAVEAARERPIVDLAKKSKPKTDVQLVKLQSGNVPIDAENLPKFIEDAKALEPERQLLEQKYYDRKLKDSKEDLQVAQGKLNAAIHRGKETATARERVENIHDQIQFLKTKAQALAEVLPKKSITPKMKPAIDSSDIVPGDTVKRDSQIGTVYQHGNQTRVRFKQGGQTLSQELTSTWAKTAPAKPAVVTSEVAPKSREGEKGAIPTDMLTIIPQFLKSARDYVSVEPVPYLKKADVSAEARQHAAARIAVPHVVNDLLSKVFPDQYRDPEAMAKTVDIINKDNILGGYYEFLDRADAAKLAGDDVAAAKWQRRAENVGDSHDIDQLQIEVENAQRDPVIAKNIERWKEKVNPVLDELYNKMKGVDPNTAREGRGAVFGARINLLPETKAAEMKNFADLQQPMPGPVTANYRNPNVKRDLFDRAAKFTGNYSTDAQAVLTNVLGHRLNETSKLDFYNALQDKGVGQIVAQGEDAPAEINGQKAVRLPVKMPQTNSAGETSIVEKNLYVQQDIAREVRDVLNTDMKLTPNPVAQFLTQVQVAQLADMTAHLKNIHSVLAAAPATKRAITDMARRFPGVGTVDSIRLISKTAAEVAKDTPAIREEIADMAKQGLIRPKYPSTGVQKITRAQDLIHAVDTASRITMNRFFTKLADAGRVEDTPANRQSFVQQIGEYNDRLLSPLMRAAKQSGLSPFIVAGRNFNRQGIRLVTGNPGVKASSVGEAAKMRAANVAMTLGVTYVTLPAIFNLFTTGSLGGRPGTPLGAIDLGYDEDEKGKHKIVDVAQLLGIRRGLRATGLNALVEGLREGKSAGEITDDAIKDVATTQMHPWLGPALGFAFQTLTGSRLDLRGGPIPAEARNMGGSGQYLENARVAFKNQNRLLYEAASPLIGTAEDNADTGYGWRLARAFVQSPISAFGVFDAQTPAMKLAQEIKRQKGTFTKTPEQAASRAKAQDLLTRADNGEDVDNEIREALEDGSITQKQVQSMTRNRQLSPLAVSVKYMGLVPDAMRIWQLASPKERQDISAIVEKKINNAVKQGHLADADRQTLENLGFDTSAAASFGDQVRKGDMSKDDADVRIQSKVDSELWTEAQAKAARKDMDRSQAEHDANNLDASDDEDFTKIESFLQSVADKDKEDVAVILSKKARAKSKDASPKAQAEADRLWALIDKYLPQK